MDQEQVCIADYCGRRSKAMNTAELAQALGQTVLVSFDVLLVSCKVLNAKLAYGNVRYLVSPVSGSGQVWVDSARVRFTDKAKEQS